ncbi:MAG: hypothetical protein N0E59_02310 [Candidatus Thiodiazotropha taylori]|nr:hypothetical protein [Candidatus Thiodiazotropha taylori]MCG8051895.1 hypothetical protein [Candidatus Thiodiazotropha taylori]MCG8109573.1 hypothetical protein [Candidatus Thiodiazotropha taylori]MCW4281917.1 hypothetical protein [Candidatus Thiodiazotropha taylori]MCW4306103.1 hypothetical protein [Candidatus Thiodiazotropha taylori]
MSKQKIVTTQEPPDLIQPYLVGGYQRSVPHSLLSKPPKQQFQKFSSSSDILDWLSKSPFRLTNETDQSKSLI